MVNFIVLKETNFFCRISLHSCEQKSYIGHGDSIYLADFADFLACEHHQLLTPLFSLSTLELDIK